MLHRELIRNSNELVKKLFKEYYKDAELVIPSDYVMREFAFQPFDSNSYIRHKSFSSLALLREYILNLIPKHAYFSSALYRDPSAENMDDKGWIGADLIFDIDADEIPGCKPINIKVFYEDGSYDEVDVVSSKCIELAKEHEEQLLDILINDFGFTHDEIEVNFTGNRGFHTRIHPKDKSWLTLDSVARREIVDYLKGLGIDLRYIMLSSNKFKIIPPKPTDGGWRRRVAKLIRELSELTEDQLINLIHRLSVSVDEKVTPDTSRLVRICGSLNGKTGLIVTKVNLSSLHDFKVTEELSPFIRYSAVVIPLVDLKDVEILDYKLDLVKGMNYKLPASVAVYLALKGLALLARII